ncbi:unnamed protein product [Gongylonema pulchrum]|uniref:Uncharacterized protein n=1 Tax=Gongylonema pulchrum TaxID=637853 RepID=A0A183E9R5_9BILA|nr:unnamed protein product [Gongylonema pulchrum]
MYRAAIIGIDLNVDVLADDIKYNDLVLLLVSVYDLCVQIKQRTYSRRVIITSNMRKSSPWPSHIGVLEAWPEKDLWHSEHFSAKEFSEGSFEIVKNRRKEKLKLKYTWKRVCFFF